MSKAAKASAQQSKLGGLNNTSMKQANHKSSSGSTSEPMKCTGKFKDDFDSLCAIKNIKYVPEIVSRSRRPGSALQNAIIAQQTLLQQQQQALKEQSDVGSQTAASKKTAASLAKSKANTVAAAAAAAAAANANQNNADGDHEVEQNPEIFDLPPKSFVLKESPDYFKPKIHVEMDNPDKLDTVTEIYIKGWKIEKPLMEILNVCIPAIDQLNTLNLWNVGLDEETVRLLSSMLPTCVNLKTLILDNNPIRDPAYHVLLYEENSNVQHLSLRNNMIDDLAARYISCGLGDVRRANKKLLSLNLNSNSIGDEGASSLARALRTNRTLLVLSLANNRIGDAGSKSFSEVISRFPLTFEEILYRRQVISGRNSDKSLSPLGRKLNGSKDRPTSQNKSSNTNTSASETTKGGRKDKSSTKKSNESTLSGTAKADQSSTTHEKKSIKESTLSKTKKDERLRKDRSRESTSLGDSRNPKSLKQSAKSSGKRTTRDVNESNIIEPIEQTTFSPKNSALLEISPLTDIAENLEDNLVLIGNRTLISLNLSRNYLTEKSIEHFLLGLQYQSTLMAIHQTPGNGLLRLVINNNKFSSENENYLRLIEFIKLKDPFNKPPAVINANHDSESVSGKESVMSRMKSGAKH